MKEVVIYSIFLVLLLVNVFFYSAGFVVTNNESMEEYSFSIVRPSVKFFSAQFVHSGFDHISNNLLAFTFGSLIIFLCSFYYSDESLLYAYLILLLIGFASVLPGTFLNYIFNNLPYAFGFSGVAVAVLTFALILLPKLTYDYFDKFFHYPKKLKQSYISSFQFVLLGFLAYMILSSGGNMYTHFISYFSSIAFYLWKTFGQNS